MPPPNYLRQPLLWRSATPWKCNACLREPGIFRNLRQSSFTTKPLPRAPARSKRSRRLLYTAVGVTALAGAATFTDPGRHAFTAVQRSGRVLLTLYLCIHDYRTTLKNNDGDRAAYDALLKACHKRCAQRTLSAMEKNGSMFIKLGQHLSSMNYLLPQEWCETFIPLQDKCPVSSYESIEAMVLNDTGSSLSEFFSEFEKEPIGAASLAQVHRAVMRDTGQRVAVKVQHPALDEWAPLDLALTGYTFATLKRFFPEYDLTWLSEELETSLPQELDFEREGANATRARNYFAAIPTTPLIIPAVTWARRRILVMDYVTGARPDDLAYLDSHGIDRDEVSAALARIFNEMIFGDNAPLHCDPHGGNIAVRYTPPEERKSRLHKANTNFDIILYDHGLYRDIPQSLRRSYAKLWLAVLDADEARMRRYAYEVAGIDEESFPLFASAITGRDYAVVTKPSGVAQRRTNEEREAMSGALGEGLLSQLVLMLGRVPRVILLILKTNDLTRSLDDSLQTRHGPHRTFLILARYASRTVFHEQIEAIRNGATSSLYVLWPSNLIRFAKALAAYVRVKVVLKGYETWLGIKGAAAG